jgi:DnaJ-class molecular chaperone
MAATHSSADLELLSKLSGPYDPSPEAMGYCGVCRGSGEESAIDYMLDGKGDQYENCGSCGGDGVSTFVDQEGLPVCQEN